MIASIEGRIIGGEDVPSPIPWQVHLKDGNSRGFCGGTILDKKTVLTAAHCFDERDKYSDDYFVAAGVTDFNKNVKVSNPSQDYIYIYIKITISPFTPFSSCVCSILLNLPKNVLRY